MQNPTPEPVGDDYAARHQAHHRPSVKLLADDGVSLHVYELPRLPAAWVEPLTSQAPPPYPELLSRHQIGHAQRIPDGYVVWSATDSGVLYPRADHCRAVCSALGFTG
jgi:hypothetical protein